jgi:glycosyltransferase involved in cell wall biosynthesis
MRILMLGWEFPPFIAGGLGTACYGLTRALDRLGHHVVFVLPRPVERSHASHIKLLAPAASAIQPVAGGAGAGAAMPAVPVGGNASVDDAGSEPHGVPGSHTVDYSTPGFEHVTFRGVPASFSSPYPGFSERPKTMVRTVVREGGRTYTVTVDEFGNEVENEASGFETTPGYSLTPIGGGAGAAYHGDVIGDSERYARLVVALCRREKFDVIHAHDWMTFPAGQALARVTGRPLVVHVHSTEFDRAGEHVNQRVYDIERRGCHGAMRVVAVSNLTKSILVNRYGVPGHHVDVIWNGIENENVQPTSADTINPRDRIVLFLGRITMQKGPEYFIRAAKLVLEKIPDAKFIVAGSGDMAVRMIEEAAHLGIGHRVLFTGFLRGKDVDRVFRMANCYVMPSVSEPFGIAPLEAMRNDVPTIISKQSGVSEALTHVLKVDFWDIKEMANKIVAVLRHPPLGQTMREHGSFELRKLTWDGAAAKCVESYQAAIGGQRQPVAAV